MEKVKLEKWIRWRSGITWGRKKWRWRGGKGRGEVELLQEEKIEIQKWERQKGGKCGGNKGVITCCWRSSSVVIFHWQVWELRIENLIWILSFFPTLVILWGHGLQHRIQSATSVVIWYSVKKITPPDDNKNVFTFFFSLKHITSTFRNTTSTHTKLAWNRPGKFLANWHQIQHHIELKIVLPFMTKLDHVCAWRAWRTRLKPRLSGKSSSSSESSLLVSCARFSSMSSQPLLMHHCWATE